MTFRIGTPHTKGAGYFINDKNLRTRQEADVQTCAHCGAVLKMQEWKKCGAWCAQEMRPLCIKCGKRAQLFGCEPIMRKIEQVFEAQMRFERLSKDAGPDEPVPQQIILTGSH
jgi:hypothetical protein